MSSPFQRARARVVAGALGAALTLGAALALGGALAAPAGAREGRPPAAARGEWKVPAEVPVRFVARITTSGCARDSIPRVSLTGAIEVGALGARFLFQRGDGPPAQPAPGDGPGQVDVVRAGTAIPVSPQRVEAAAAETLYCFVQLEDARGRALSDPVLVGRCVDGTVAREVAGMLPVDVDARVETEGCGDRQGPRVSLTGSVRMGGVWARLTFRATPDPLVAPPETAALGVSRDVSLLAPGRTVSILGPPAYGVAGGNPTIYVQLTLGSGVAAGPAARLGRCSEFTP